MSQDFIAQKYIDKLSNIQDEVALVVNIHLFTEHVINRIMKEKKKNPNQHIIERSSFVVKLDLLYNMDLIPKELYENINKLNTLRNKCAHNLDYDFVGMDCNYNMTNEVFDPKKPFPSINLEKLNLKDRLGWIGGFTFGWLVNHSIFKLGLQV
ncbi:hypothetical protein COM66_10910 [Bacillus cereus]|uniref:hypothetical protein n=1 Tax=Bacillus cereus TaxID=1396 RepID=UPI000BEE7708|nr:hypothetical protein [Bacillus cereus]PDY05746.1 hypothetical protein COM66_10910 [Bacillus cereus]